MSLYLKTGFVKALKTKLKLAVPFVTNLLSSRLVVDLQ